jgi:hypothetical protein
VPRPPRVDIDATLDGELADSVGRALEERMIARFCPPLGTDEVRRHLAAAATAFHGARVPNFLEVLIERAALVRLRRAADGAVTVNAVDTDAAPPPSFRLYLIDKEAS